MPNVPLKAPPHSDEAEQAVLGGLMLDDGAWFDITEIVSASDFYRPQHQLIFDAMQALMNDLKPLDALTVSSQLESSGHLTKMGDNAYLAYLVDRTPGTSNVVTYARIVRESADIRRLIRALNEASDKALNPDGLSSEELLDYAEQLVFKIAEARLRPGVDGRMAPLIGRVMERIREREKSGNVVPGLATGLTDLDAKTAGLRNGNLVVIAGRPSMGKTSLAMNIAEHATRGKTPAPALVVSLESDPDEIGERLLAARGRVDSGDIQRGSLSATDGQRLDAAAANLITNALEIQNVPDLTPTGLRGRARRFAREHGGVGLIVVDYLQLMRWSGRAENRTNEISGISRSLKSLAIEMACPVIAVSQLSRAVENRTSKRPVMADLRDSGAIEQDADLILFVYRDEEYNENTEDKGIAELIIGKQRNGPTGTVKVRFFDNIMKFEDLAPDRHDEQARAGG